jgi:hypothetical protein
LVEHPAYRFAHVVGGPDRYGLFVNNDPVTFHVVTDRARYREYMPEIRRTILVRRRTHSVELE